MIFVRSKEQSVWRSEPRNMVRCLVEALWAIDGQSVEVEPGLVVSFSKEDDAEYFLTCHGKKEAPRCEPVYVVPGDVVAFHDAKDAEFFVSAGRAEALTDAQVYELMQAAQAAAAGDAEPDEGDDEMQKVKLENKAGPAAPETKSEPAPKPAAPKSGGKKGK